MRLVILLVVLASCGDNRTGTPFERFNAEADAARCDYLTRCGLFADRASCDGFFRIRYDAGLAVAINEGTVRYNGAAAEDCHEAIARMSCDLVSREGRNEPEVCSRVFIGTRVEGEGCAFDSECLSGACSVDRGCPLDMCCSGTCLPPRGQTPVNEACATSRDCIPDTFCGSDDLCHPLAKVGAECQRDDDCDYGSGCIGPSDLMPGNCRELPKLGESCPYARCAEINARCDETSHACVALGLPGASCQSDEQCSPHAECNVTTHLCEALPRVGMACTSRCAGFGFCNLLLNKCIPPFPDGTQGCGSPNECTSLFCRVDEADNTQCTPIAVCH